MLSQQERIATSVTDVAEPAFYGESVSMQQMAVEDMALDSYTAIEPPRAGVIDRSAEQRIIREGWVSLTVKDVGESLRAIENLAEEQGGLVQYTNESEDYRGARIGNITIRVPSEAFSETMAAIRAVGLRVEDDSTNANDVTEEYTDLQTRLNVAQEEEQAYLALLDQSGSVADLLQVQRELSNVRVRIESLQGQIQYLENRTSFSTIHASLEEDVAVTLPTKTFRLDTTIKEATRGVVLIAQWLATALIWVVILGIGVVLPLGLIAWGAKGAWHNYKKR